MKFSIKDFFSKCDQIRKHFLCSDLEFMLSLNQKNTYITVMDVLLNF